jgi:hypothetical protein
MSLTSYRTAPPRAKSLERKANGGLRLKRSPPFICTHRKEKLSALRRPGNGLLSQVLRHSTIGARAFDGRVRDGIGSDRSARVTRPAKGGKEANGSSALAARVFMIAHCRPARPAGADAWASSNESVQANRAISTGKLHTLLCFHTRPIHVVVFHGS